MAADITVVINPVGVQELLKSPEVLADLMRRANAIAAQAGPGFQVEPWVGQTRARATVRTGTEDARREEATRRVLTAAIGAGR